MAKKMGVGQGLPHPATREVPADRVFELLLGVEETVTSLSLKARSQLTAVANAYDSFKGAIRPVQPPERAVCAASSVAR